MTKRMYSFRATSPQVQRLLDGLLGRSGFIREAVIEKLLAATGAAPDLSVEDSGGQGLCPYEQINIV